MASSQLFGSGVVSANECEGDREVLRRRVHFVQQTGSEEGEVVVLYCIMKLRMNVSRRIVVM